MIARTFRTAVLSISLFFCWQAMAFPWGTPKNPVLEFQTTRGVVQVVLFADKNPALVKFILACVRMGVYDHTLFHRVVEGFVLQGGGYDINFHPTVNPFTEKQIFPLSGLKHAQGTWAVILGKDRGAAAAPEFFFNLADNTALEEVRATETDVVVGTVISGMDVLEKIAHAKVGQRRGFYNVPVYPNEVLIEHVVLGVLRVGSDSLEHGAK